MAMPRCASEFRPCKSPIPRVRAKVDAILIAAPQVFGTHGYAAETTNRIAKRVGVSIGSLCEYRATTEQAGASLGPLPFLLCCRRRRLAISRSRSRAIRRRATPCGVKMKRLSRRRSIARSDRLSNLRDCSMPFDGMND
ncbi:MAG: helix-turn-helix domain-containing protein [Candidatus Binataceae bacterium]